MPRFRTCATLRVFALVVLTAALLAPAAGRAQSGPGGDTRSLGSWPAVTYDLLLVRPVAVTGAVVGAGFFAIGYPLTVWFGDPQAARAIFLDEPFRFAVRRPLGNFGGR
jgi:hypothetical protein